MITRIGTFAHSNALIAASLRTQAKLADQQTQESTGLKSTSFGGLGTDVASLLRMSSQSTRLTADNGAAQTASAYVQSAYAAVGDIADLANTIKSQLAAQISGTSLDGDSLAAYARGWLDDLQTQLNSQVGGVYLFGGEAVDAAPVDFSSADYDPTAVGNTGYYQGASTTRTFASVDGSKISLSITAQAGGFEQLARALSMVIADPGDSDTLSAAFDLVGEAVSGVGAVQEGLGVQASQLSSLISRNETKIDTLDDLASQLKGADLAQAAVLVTNYQTQLEALYSTIGTLSSSSLLKYLG
ncbi:flagellar biosynthesis protein FlgL [Caulobacter segnis]|uniref:Flagellar hook-associated protein FlgL n=2 Tax=Caulobacter segnis TaxID=88688 RepID=D5VEB9_CAUST|nr:flagellin [Caulobacter segnis]ADG08942.1 flagellar hook-associated protein FlgL [Caulobacter segnis ATCC 21756]AVQ00777.1 flagellar biosynthesis protein FlgL [Caulobacter segnis]